MNTGPRQRDRDDTITVEGVVVDTTRGFFRVRAELGGRPHFALCRVSGKMQQARIRVMLGDRVTVELSAFDTSRGRITFRNR